MSFGAISIIIVEILKQTIAQDGRKQDIVKLSPVFKLTAENHVDYVRKIMGWRAACKQKFYFN